MEQWPAFRYWFVIISLCLSTSQAYGQDQKPGFDVVSAQSTLVDGVVRLDALFDLRFGDQLIEALQNGITLNLRIDIQINKDRRFIWSSTVTSLEQRYRISYQPLTDHYILNNVNSDLVFQFPSLESLLAVVSVLNDFPLLDYTLLKPKGRYFGEIRIEVDRDSYPVPLRLMSYVYGDWHLASRWYSWPILP